MTSVMDENSLDDQKMRTCVTECTDSPTKVDESNILLQELGSGYAKYAQVDIKNEKSAVEEELEELLKRLDEFSSLVDMVRSDDAMNLISMMPEIYAESQEMEKLYTKIDKLEYAVAMIKQNMTVLEEKVVEAESVLGGNSMKKLFSSFPKPLFSKKSSEVKKSPKYEPPQIFCVEDLFVKGDESQTVDCMASSSSEMDNRK